ncbi:SAM-dependent methyltransferase [Streptomyces kanamyceticus]|uniref:Class I SAM-dependent methyltransferase n=1 Tax=Streptomyces kanamyceticus TaxID=1967 RepID=A0A5J6GP30_STRKN|nr:class I SAM-dependent methyltransferase [Streptomyces kanamyceticus]QEU96803.1 class I SAM-dependent methyltransferase [Streptomyces kanamyceticus]
MKSAEAARYWDAVYTERPTPEEPRPNARLVETVTALPPGDALDLGCGGGGDALWLADQGWRVTALDVSAVATAALAQKARARGLGDRITATQHDVRASLPDLRCDLVTAHYFHTPYDQDRTPVLNAAAGLLRVGGRLLIVDHGSTAPWSWNQDPGVRYPTPQEVAALLDLSPEQWEIDRADTPSRTAIGPDGSTAEVIDHVLLVRRTA